MNTVPASTFSEDPGAPAPPGVIPLSVPHLAGNEWAYVKECLDTGWVSSAGPFVERFEQAVTKVTGAGHGVAVVNGTAALHVALLAAGVGSGDEVLVSTLTFVAPVNAVRYCGAHPVFMDADPQTWQMDPAKVAEFLEEECEQRSAGLVNRRTGRPIRALLPVHILGLAAEIDVFVDLARCYDLRLVEDAAEGLGVRVRGRHVGTFGDTGALSFNGNKIITAGGGGMVITADPARAERARYLTTQAKDDALEYVHNSVGYNYRLTNLQAALGAAQVEQLSGFIARKRAIAARYAEAFRHRPDIIPMPVPAAHVEPTYWLYTVLLPEGTTIEARQAVVAELHHRGIGARPLWHPVHTLPPYREDQAYRVEHAPRLYTRAISLPSSVGLSGADQERVIAAVNEVLDARG